MKIAIILGTRPEIIKLSSIIRFCEREKLDYYVIHTNQHYSSEMDSIFFKELNLPNPKYNLEVGSGSQATQISKMLEGVEKVFDKELPSTIIVEGDTNSVFAGAFMASRKNIKIAHVEAGLRSYDRKMPEEINRILTDSISDYFFCPTINQKKTLLREGMSEEQIHVVGNTIVDAVLWAGANESKILSEKNLSKGKYCLLTLHRAENVDDKKRLTYLIQQIKKLDQERIIFPLHPRTKKMLKVFNLSLPKNIELLPPVGFLDMITLEKNAKVILTDSGGIQEEACILKIPCITLRTTTERPESIEVGGNILLSENLSKDFKKMASLDRNWKNPFGEGDSGEKIINILRREI